MDEDTLLRVAVLVLAENLELRAPYPGRLLVRHRTTRRHLVVSTAQWTVLQAFKEGRTVPAALKHLIHERACIPLRDFYELVLKARDSGILRVLPEAPAPAAPAEASVWTRSLDGPIARGFATAVFLALPPLLLLPPAPRAPGPGWWLLGWLLTCLAVSAGHALAACVLRGVDLEVRRPRFVLRCLLPRFTADLRDAFLGGPPVRLDCATLRLAPQALLLALGALWAPPLVLPLLCGLLCLLSPLWPSPGLEILRALRHPPRLSTSWKFRFDANRTLLRRLQSRLARDEVRFVALRLVCSAVWLLLAALAWSLARPDHAAAALDWARRVDLAALASLVFLALLLLAFLVFLGALSLALGERAATRVAAWRRNREHARSRVGGPAPDLPATLGFLKDCHPFNLLPPEPRRHVAEALASGAGVHPQGDTVLAAGDRRAALRLLFSGRLLVTRPGAAARGATLRPGALFGESFLLRGDPLPATVTASAPSVVLTLGEAAYRLHVAPHLSPEKIEDAAHKIAFLRDIPLSRHWPAHALAALARRAQIQTFAAGSVLLAAGRENTFFHLLEEGELRVVKEGRRLARLLRGDFFGELSLLRNTVAQADIVALRPGRCLAVPRQDFLLFLAQDARVALQFERIASRRLGRPVFDG